MENNYGPTAATVAVFMNMPQLTGWAL